ncbi:hypothetical protein [Streptomyces fructofermentans]|uniref:Uncharacterized protein n=1 Tax=Streptomyces fructofermentans TaxID=152141 RepID=A0A918NWC1_9ACTN|nr:hypothetical protein [Streptomyces fructofermentans]GGX99044.1 hypothetical protein GCM10010515_76500 [Streptomyces fructofermentans]
MSEIPETPVVPDLTAVFQAPPVTLLARADAVQLGDVIDTIDGPVRVREIVQRQHTYDLAGDPPGHVIRYRTLRRGGPEDVPPLHRRRLARTMQIRVRRSVQKFGRLTGHTKKIASHNPVKRGWYTDPGGYDAACSCGWKHPDVHASRDGAAGGWLRHKAGQLSEAAYADNPALLWLWTAETTHPSLPPLPWHFKKVVSRGTVGCEVGDGIAFADLDMLTVARARTVMGAWQAVFDVDPEGTYEDYRPGPVDTLDGARPGWTTLRLSGTGIRTRIILDARIDDPDSGPT